MVSRTRAWMSWTLPFSSVRVIRCIYFARARNADIRLLPPLAVPLTFFMSAA